MPRLRAFDTLVVFSVRNKMFQLALLLLAVDAAIVRAPVDCLELDIRKPPRFGKRDMADMASPPCTQAKRLKENVPKKERDKDGNKLNKLKEISQGKWEIILNGLGQKKDRKVSDRMDYRLLRLILVNNSSHPKLQLTKLLEYFNNRMASFNDYSPRS